MSFTGVDNEGQKEGGGKRGSVLNFYMNSTMFFIHFQASKKEGSVHSGVWGLGKG